MIFEARGVAGAGDRNHRAHCNTEDEEHAMSTHDTPSEGGRDMADEVTEPVAGVPSDNTTLSAVLADFEAAGFTAQLIVNEDGSVDCASCAATIDPAELDVHEVRRLEGASDPDDMMSVVAASCPRCDVRGTMVVRYGPLAGPGDQAVSRALRRPPSSST